MRDPRSLTDEVEYFDPPTETQKELARRTVCSFAENVEDARLLLRMLGLHPGESDDEDETAVLSPYRLSPLINNGRACGQRQITL